MGRHGNGAWTVFLTERKLLLVLRKKYNELKATRQSVQQWKLLRSLRPSTSAAPQSDASPANFNTLID